MRDHRSFVDHLFPDFAERMIFAIAEQVVVFLREPVNGVQKEDGRQDKTK